MNKKTVLSYVFSCYASCAYGQTTIVYNVSSNTCSGTNMNCEGLVNSVGDNVVWGTIGSTVVSHDKIYTAQELQLTFNNASFQTIHSLIPTQGSAKNKRIRVLFVTIPFSTLNTAPLSLPANVEQEIKTIRKEKASNTSIKYIVKIYRQFSMSNPGLSEWVDVATLFIPKNAPPKQTITLNPNGTAMASSVTDSGEKIDLVIELQKQY